MTTGYVVGGRGDLDILFAPRVSAAGANVGFTVGGVDLAQRFEPRGATTAIPNTGFKSGATDLAQIFKDGTSLTFTNFSITAGLHSTEIGYKSIDWDAPNGWGVLTPTSIWRSWRIGIAEWDNSLARFDFALMNAGSPAPDADATFAAIQVTGTFSDSGGSSVTRNLTRAARTSTGTGVLSGAFPAYRVWSWNASSFPIPKFINGNAYLFQLA